MDLRSLFYFCIMVIFYLIAMCVISAVNLLILYSLFPKKRENFFYSSVFHFLAIAQLGHLFLALSTNVEEAILANKIAYIGAAFFPMFIFLGVLDVCQIRLKRKTYLLLLLPSIFVFTMACTTGYKPWFYEKVEYITTMGVGNFAAEYGPFHVCFNVMFLSYMAACMGVWLYACIRKKNIPIYNLAYTSLIGVVCGEAFIVSRALGTDTLVMPACYVIIEVILLFAASRFQRYDLNSLIVEKVQKNNFCAYISITPDYHYVGANELAFRYFPELLHRRIDSVLKDSNESFKAFLNVIHRAVSMNQNLSYFQIGDDFFKCLVRSVSYGYGSKGFLLRIEKDVQMQQYSSLLGRYNSSLTDLKEKNLQIHSIQKQMSLGLVYMVEFRDGSTGGHLKRVAHAVQILVGVIRQNANWQISEDFCNNVIRSAPMHDVGKIAIKDSILTKMGKFLPEEYEVMKTHAEIGAAIIKNVLSNVESEEMQRIAQNMAFFHHERWDGSGYPKGLKGEQIPLEARIMAIADVYDALVSERSYKKKFSFAEADKIILESMGTQFDPNLQKCYEECRPKLEAYYSSYNEE